MAFALQRSRLRHLVSRFFEEPVARLLHRLRVHPSNLTLVGLTLSGLAAYFASIGMFWIAGGILLLSGAADLLDGALARLSGRATPFGAFLDSAIDRIGEGALFLGLLLYSVTRQDVPMSILVYLAFLGSLLVSYLRARAEGLGVSGSEGIMTRPERLIVLAIGLFAHQVSVALGIIAALSLVTIGQRFLHAWRHLRRKE